MMPNKKRKTIIIVSILIILILIILILGYLYITTDMFKSNSTLFIKYLGNATQNVESLFEDKKGKEYNNLLENNKYTSSSEITARYTQNMGTTDENTSNVINNLKVDINGQTDKLNNMDYKKLSLYKNEESLINLEYLKSDNKYGIKFADLFKQYLAVENSNLVEFAPKIGINTTVPNTIENIDLRKALTFSDEELNNINNKYVNIIAKDFQKEKFTKTKDTSITVRNKTMQTNAYTLKLTKEQLNNIYILILEGLKKDETVLSKVDNLNAIYQVLDTNNNSSNQNNNENAKTLRNDIIEKIDAKIIDIKNKNIGDDEAKITVYENMKKTIRTSIETKEYKLNIDTLFDSSGTYVQIFYEIFGNKENSMEITIDKKQDELNIKYERINDNKTNTASIVQTRNIVDNNKEINTTFDYSNGIDKIEMKIKNNTTIVNNFSEKIQFTNDNIVVLNKLNDEQLKSILNTINDKMIERQQLIAGQVNYDELLNILKRFGAISDKVTISSLNTLTKTEISKFNAEFEIYKGEELAVDNVDNLLKVTKNNLDTLEVVSDNVLKLNIKQNVKNEELANKVSQIINSKENKGKKYSIKMEYDKESGIVNTIIIEIMKNS